MRIALVTKSAWPSVGGTEVVVRTLANELAKRNEVRVFTHRIDGDGPTWKGPADRAKPFAPVTDPESGVLTTQLRMTSGDMALLAPYLLGPRRVGSRVRPLHHVSWAVEMWHARVAGRRFAVQLGDAEVIHRFNGNRMALATVRAARRLGRPVVVSPFAHPGQWDDDEISALAYRESDLVLATSSTDAATYSGLDVSPQRLQICPLPTREPIRGGGLGLRRSGPVTGPLVLFLGARREYKGVDRLLAAAWLLAREIPAAQVAFVGPGPRLQRPLPDNVLDVGEVDDGARDAWLDAADVACLPSAYESWGLAVSEAWSVGIPVVTSDIPILRQRVNEVEGGLAVAPEPRALADALSRLLTDDELRATMGQAGREHYLRHLSPEACAAWHEHAYRKLIEQRNSVPSP